MTSDQHPIIQDVADVRPNPYIGPRSYQRGETLYGRDLETFQLIDLLIAERIVLLYSPSGAGKTSLIQASLIPALTAEGFRVLPTTRVGLEPPEQGEKANRYVLSLLLSLEEDLLPEVQTPLSDLVEMTVSEYLASRLDLAEGVVEQVLIFDQFEEILTVDPTAQAAKMEFFSQVGLALRPRERWALFAMREEFRAGLDPYLRPMPTRFRTTFRLELLGERAALEAVKKPAQAVGVAFTDEAAHKLVDDLRLVRVQRPSGETESALGLHIEPVQLQVVCRRLWESLDPDDRYIDEADIGSVGDVDQALRDYYRDRLAVIADQTGQRERVIRDWFQSRLITKGGLRGQVLQDAQQSDGLDNTAIWQLVDAHLVRAETRRGVTWFELAHDRLINPVLEDNRAWRDANLSALQRHANLWVEEGRPAGLLLLDLELLEAERWVESHGDQLEPHEADFLEASRSAQAIAEREKRQTRWIRALAVLALVISFVAIAAAVLANQAQGLAEDRLVVAETARAQSVVEAENARVAKATSEVRRFESQANADLAAKRLAESIAAQAAAERQAKIAFSRQLASQSSLLLDNQFDLALLLSLQATRITDTLEAQGGLLTALEYNPKLITYLRGHEAPVVKLALNDSGNLLVSLDESGRLILWNLTEKEPGQRWEAFTSPLQQMVFSADDSILITNDGSVIQFLDVETGRLLDSPFSLVEELDGHLRLSPDGRLLVQRLNSTLQLWDLEQGDPFSELIQVETDNGVGLVAFTPDARYLAIHLGWNEAILWDVASNERVGLPLSGHANNIDVLTFGPRGDYLLTASYDGTSRLWGVPGGELVTLLPEDSTWTLDVDERGVAFHPNGHRLALGRANGKILLWDPVTNQQVGESLVGHQRDVLSLAFSQDGQVMASGGMDHNILLWDFNRSGRLALAIDTQRSDNWAVAFSPDGKTLAASAYKTVGRWDVRTGQQIGELVEVGSNSVFSLTFHPSKGVLITGGANAELANWDIEAGERIGEMIPLPATGSVYDIQLSQDGRLLAAVAGGKVGAEIYVWDWATGQLVHQLEAPPARYFSVAFSPDGTTLAAGTGSGHIEFWDTETWFRSGPDLLVHPSGDWVMAVAFSPDGTTLASGAWDGSFNLTRLESDQEVMEPAVVHTGAIQALAFHPEQPFIASGGDDGRVIIWEAQTGQTVSQLSNPVLSDVNGVAFSPDGSRLAAGGAGALVLWNFDPSWWADQICQVTARGMTEVEWRRFIGPDYSYHPVCMTP